MQVTSARSSGVDIILIPFARKDMAPELDGPLPVKITSKCQYLLLSNRMLEDLLPVADGLEACAVSEPSDEEDATEELAAAVDNWAKPIDGGLERSTVYTFFCGVGLWVDNVCWPRSMITNQNVSPIMILPVTI
jgi:hypothetical protein